MQEELLKYLKSAISQDWLHSYDHDLASNQDSSTKVFSSKLLYQLTQAKLAEISAIATQSNTRLVVFIVEDNSVNFIAAFLAGIINQVDLFLCDPGWQKHEWQQVLNIVKPDLIFGQAKTISLISQLRLEQKLQYLSKHKSPAFVAKTKSIKQSLIMIPTGGTSGKIRFAIHNWDTLSASVKGFKTFFACQKINSFCTLPFYHVSGLMQLMRSLLTQGNLILCPYKSITNQNIKFHKSAYFISLVPTQLQYLLASIPHWLQDFKTVLIGGAPARRSLLNLAREYQVPLALTYGMTETASGVVALKPDEFLAGNHSNGQVFPHAKILINNDEKASKISPAKNTKLQENKTGLIEIYSTSLCLGYYPKLFNSAQPFLTDDLGYFDSKNYLYLLGRNSHKIITGGENVFPVEVETVIYSTHIVQDVCVLGIPDRKWGQKVTAVYVPLTSTSNSNLIKQKIKDQLAKYKQPKHWVEVEQIPRNNRGKVNYQKLKAIALSRISEQNKRK